MGNEQTPKPKEDKSGELLESLTNRLLSLETKSQEFEKEKQKSYVDGPFLDNKLAEVRAEITELRKSISELVKPAPAPAPAPAPTPGSPTPPAAPDALKEFVEGADYASLY